MKFPQLLVTVVLLTPLVLWAQRWGTATITSPSVLPSAQVGMAYSYQFTETGGKPGYTWTVSSLPAGLALATNGLLSGTPANAGAGTFSVTVRDSRGQGSVKSFSLTVAPPPLIFPNQTPPQGQVGAAYSYQLVALGGVPPYSWTVSSGAMPPGLILSSNGVVSGTPTTAGSFTTVLTVTDQTYQVLTITAHATIRRSIQ